MNEETGSTIEEAHREFGKQANNRVWQLLGQGGRTEAEDDEMVEAAHASNYHWRAIGTPVNHQRGEWLLAHVYTILEEADPALKHARRCLEITNAHPDQMADFDVAYAYEGNSRALGLNGQIDEACTYYDKAKSAGDAIANAEDKEIFMGDFTSGNWFGVA
jgi:hypothetical protein